MVTSIIAQASPSMGAGTDAVANPPSEPREHGHANGASAAPTDPAASGFAEAGEAAAPGAQPSAAPTAASSGRDTAVPSIAEQVAPALTTVIQGRAIGRALSVSITPDDLGSISITVSRAADGTSVIQLGAEHISTLEMLHASQAELGQSLDQASAGHGSYALSFTWNGADAGSSWAGGQGGQREQHGEQRPALFASSMGEDLVTRSQNTFADANRVDVTA